MKKNPVSIVAAIALFLWFLWAIFCLSLFGCAIYVIYHFVSKYW